MNFTVIAYLIGSRLDVQEQCRLFEILHKDIDLFAKLFPDTPLIAHIKKEKTWNHPLAQAYDNWLATRS